MRKYYLDNLRLMVILFLFPYHTLLIYSGLGPYYFNVTNNYLANAFLLFLAPWFMQLLFAVAGIATFYSLKKRTSHQYLKERVSKLLIPTVAGVFLVIPFSTYFGYLYNGFNGSFLNFYWYLMTNWMAFLGNGYLLGPLWFLLYLFIVSIVALPLIMKYRNSDWKIPTDKITVPKLLLLVIPLAIGNFFINIYPNKSIVQFFLIFIFGYFFLSDDGVQERLEKNRWPLFISFLAVLIIYVATTAGILTSGVTAASTSTVSLSTILILFLSGIWTNLILWLGVLGIMGMGKHYLEFKNKTTLYLAGISFPIYIFHLSWINMFAYYLLQWIPGMMVVQIILIMILSFIFTIATVEVLKRIKVTRFLFGIKK